METPSTYETEGKPTHHEPTPGRCNARTRDGGYCPSWPTKTSGKRCRMHGGAAGSGRPVTSGRYSKVLRASLKRKYSEFLRDTDYRSLVCEIAIARSLFAEYLSRFGKGNGEIRLKVDDICRLFDWLDKIGRQVERVARIENQTAMTMSELQLLEVLIVGLLRNYLSEDQQEKFSSQLAEVLGSEGFSLPPPGIEVVDGNAREIG